MRKTLLALAVRGSTAIAAMDFAASGASAQVVPAGGAYFSSSKSEAILGGQSALAAIMAQQSGQPLARPTLTLTPAGYSLPVTKAAMPVNRPPIAMDRPDVFGSVALPIGRSSLQRRWRKVSAGAVGAASSAYAAGLNGRPAIERVEAVNRYVNARVQFVNDDRQYGAADHWANAADTLRRGKGDCEDYAIAKLQMLRRAGFSDGDLYLVIVRDLLRRADHAVLVVRAEGRLLVLDNGTDRLIDSDELRDYRPVLTFSGNRSWTHGYRREAPPMVMASNETPASVALAAASLSPVAPSAFAN